jgi:hypothetical protein
MFDKSFIINFSIVIASLVVEVKKHFSSMRAKANFLWQAICMILAQFTTYGTQPSRVLLHNYVAATLTIASVHLIMTANIYKHGFFIFCEVE